MKVHLLIPKGILWKNIWILLYWLQLNTEFQQLTFSESQKDFQFKTFHLLQIQGFMKGSYYKPDD